MRCLIAWSRIGWGFPSGTGGKEPCQCRRSKEIRTRSLGQEDPLRRAWQSTPVFLPRESREPRSLGGAIVGRVTKSQTWLKQLSTHAGQAGVDTPVMEITLTFFIFSTCDVPYMIHGKLQCKPSWLQCTTLSECWEGQQSRLRGSVVRLVTDYLKSEIQHSC